jgi:hypothetical protein
MVAIHERMEGVRRADLMLSCSRRLRSQGQALLLSSAVTIKRPGGKEAVRGSC